MPRPRAEVEIRQQLKNEVRRIKDRHRRQQQSLSADTEHTIELLQRAMATIELLEAQLKRANGTLSGAML